jgi:hypothetical protein
VVDLGRGTPEEFAEHAADIKGRIVLVRPRADVRRRHHPTADASTTWRAQRRGRLS